MNWKPALVHGILAVLAAGCGDNGPSGPGPVLILENTLVFERPDGSQVDIKADYDIWCGPWEEGLIPVRTLHIYAGCNASQAGRCSSWWTLSAVVEDITLGEPQEFPNYFIWDQPDGVSLFMLDGANELSSAEPEASGSIVFQQLTCGPPGEVEFTIDAVLGSEFHDGDSMRVTGTFHAHVGTWFFSPPAGTLMGARRVGCESSSIKALHRLSSLSRITRITPNLSGSSAIEESVPNGTKISR